MGDRIRALKINRYDICQAIGLCLLAAFVCRTVFFSLSNITASVLSRRGEYYVLLAIMMFNLVTASAKERNFRVYVIVLTAVFLLFSFVESSYSPIDEVMNFENINHILKNHTLATFDSAVDHQYLTEATNCVQVMSEGMINYEAVQAPLYYLLMALFGLVFKNAFLRLHVFRAVSLLSVFVVYYFFRRTVTLLRDFGMFRVDETATRVGCLLTVFSPAYLFRASRLNNEILVCVLMSILLYAAAGCITEGYNPKAYWLMAGVSSALFLTKSTAIYAYVVIVTVALFQRQIKKAVETVLVSAIPIIPWVVFNIRHYGALTAIDKHLEYVLPIVNPYERSQDLFECFFDVLPNTYFFAEEVAASAGQLFWAGISFFLVMAFFVCELIEVLKTIRDNKLDPEKYDTASRLRIVLSLVLLSGVGCLLAGTVLTKVVSLRGRYFYCVCTIPVLLFLLRREHGGKNVRRGVFAVFMITLSVVSASFYVRLANRYFTDEQLFASRCGYIGLADVTDDEWINGYSRDGVALLVELPEAFRRDGYCGLIGREVVCGEQSAAIAEVSDIFEEDERRYIRLYLDEALDVSDTDGSTIELGARAELRSEDVNTKGFSANIGNVEGQKLTQSFTVKEDGQLRGCAVLLATFEAEKYPAAAIYEITDESGAVLVKAQNKCKMLKDNQYARLLFDEPLDVRKNEKLSFSFVCDSASDAPLTAWVTEDDMYAGGELYINEEEKPDLDIGLRLLFQNQLLLDEGHFAD